jgi:hypothetical protein
MHRFIKRISPIIVVFMQSSASCADENSLMMTLVENGVSIVSLDALESAETRMPDQLLTAEVIYSRDWTENRPSYNSANMRMLASSDAAVFGNYFFLSDKSGGTILGYDPEDGKEVELWDLCWLIPWMCDVEPHDGYTVNAGLDDYLSGHSVSWNDWKLDENLKLESSVLDNDFRWVNDSISAALDSNGRLYIYSETTQDGAYLWSPEMKLD